MINKAIYVFLFVVISLIVGCTDTKQERIAAIDSMQGVLAQVSRRSEQVDPIVLQKFISDVNKKIVRLAVLDSLPDSEKQMVLEYGLLEGRMENCLQASQQIKISLNQSRKQLINLRQDVETGVWHTDSLNQFLETEFLYVSDLDDGMDEVIVQLNACFETFEELDPRVMSLLINMESE